MFGQESRKLAGSEFHIEILSNIPRGGEGVHKEWMVAIWDKDPDGDTPNTHPRCIATIPCLNEEMARHIYTTTE